MKKKHYCFRNALKLSCAVTGFLLMSIPSNGTVVDKISTITLQKALKHTVAGTVTNEKKEPVVGASILIKGTNIGTTTDTNGKFKLEVLNNNTTLIISSVGYVTKEIKIGEAKDLQILLAENIESLEEVIVTGVFDQRKRIDAAVAISTISAKEIKQQVPFSAVDLLKDVPGVYVNSAAGEIRNQIVVRGTPVSNNVAVGYYYVSMQEDGLPITNLTGGSFGPDYFLRSDATIERVEALRGGSSSITGSDAPGGSFNYVSKKGTDTHSGVIEGKYGLEGDVNPYYKLDFNFGGPLKGGMKYNFGGFYRSSDGARNPGYALNYGGQVKGNITKNIKGGSMKLYIKALSDHTGFFDFLPYQDYSNPHIVDGFKNTDTFAGPGNNDYNYQYSTNSPTLNFNPKKLTYNRDLAIGFEIKKNFGNGWNISNNLKVSNKMTDSNFQMPLSIMDASSFTFAAFTGFLFNPGGQLKINDLATGKNLYTMNNNFPFLQIVNDNLPNTNVSKSPLIWSLAFKSLATGTEVMDQLVVNKSVGKTNFSVGGYLGISNVDFQDGLAGMQYVTFENKPRPLALTYTQADGKVIQYTSPTGWFNTGANYRHNILTNTRLDFFFAQNTAITNNLTLDYGVRFNYSAYQGTTTGQLTNTALTAAGGPDKNLLTEYDNNSFDLNTWSYNKKYNSFSFSGSLNYKFSEQQALYARYSLGKKAPDVSAIIEPTSKEAADLLSVSPIEMKQIEVGYKGLFKTGSISVTPFYSNVSKIPSYTWASAGGGVSYWTPIAYSEIETKGVEIEGDVKIGRYLSIRGQLTIQDPKSVIAQSWDTRESGIKDDTLLVYKNSSVGLTPKSMASVTPSFQMGGFNAFVAWRYVGPSPANANNAFTLPAYSTFNVGLGYQFSKRIATRININNITNSLGVTGWYPPGGFPASLFPQNFTAEKRIAEPNASWGARTTPPRSYFITLSYSI